MLPRRLVPALVGWFLSAGSLVYAGSPPGSGGELPADAPRVEDLQERMLADPGIMALILALQNAPEMQALLSDPKELAAVQAGDFGALLSDPRFVKLLNDPRVREIGKWATEKGSGGKE